MDARLLTRLTNVALVAAVGMTAAHLLLPARAGADPMARTAFIGSVALVGALAAWRERRAHADLQATAPRGTLSLWLVAGALVALLLAVVAYYVVHA